MKLQTLLIAILATVTMVGCSNGKKGNSGSTKFNRKQVNQIMPGTSTCSTTSWGRIYDNAIDPATFALKVADFTYRPAEDIGQISPFYGGNTGIEFQMTIRIQGGQLAEGSMAGFKITDSFSLDGGGVIAFNLGTRYNAGGQASGNQFNVQLGDEKGAVRFSGNRVMSQGQQVLYGTAYYTNIGQTERQLGEFVIGACAMVGI